MILASNRLPVTITTTAEGPALAPSSGGLASALRELHEAGEGCWIGWLGDTRSLDDAAVTELSAQAAERRLKAVALTAEDVSRYYDGYSNAVLWPLFHYLLDKVQLDASDEWRAYVSVNERFADAIAAEVRSAETVWVHDYQLMLVPSLLGPGYRRGTNGRLHSRRPRGSWRNTLNARAVRSSRARLRPSRSTIGAPIRSSRSER